MNNNGSQELLSAIKRGIDASVRSHSFFMIKDYNKMIRVFDMVNVAEGNIQEADDVSVSTVLVYESGDVYQISVDGLTIGRDPNDIRKAVSPVSHCDCNPAIDEKCICNPPSPPLKEFEMEFIVRRRGLYPSITDSVKYKVPSGFSRADILYHGIKAMALKLGIINENH